MLKTKLLVGVSIAISLSLIGLRYGFSSGENQPFLKAQAASSTPTYLSKDSMEQTPEASLDSVSDFTLASSAEAYVFIQSRYSDKCIHLSAGDGDEPFSNGARITQWECLNQDNLQWTVRDADDGYVYIVSKLSGKCIHLSAGDGDDPMSNGARITQWECIDQNNVQWSIERARNGYYYIVSRFSGKCIHLSAGTRDEPFSDGARITQWECINEPNVQWRLITAN